VKDGRKTPFELALRNNPTNRDGFKDSRDH
jgi:hypothetical protein